MEPRYRSTAFLALLLAGAAGSPAVTLAAPAATPGAWAAAERLLQPSARSAAAALLSQDAASGNPLAMCQTLLNGLGLDPEGATLLCPSNLSWDTFARELGYRGPDPVLRMLAHMPIATLQAVVAYHVVPGAVLPASALPAAPAPRRPLRTLGGAALAAGRRGDGGVELLLADAGADAVAGDGADDYSVLTAGAGAGNAASGASAAAAAAGAGRSQRQPRRGRADLAVLTPDRTFEGPYVRGESRYVIHVLGDVMVPPGAAAALEDVRTANLGVSRRMLRA